METSLTENILTNYDEFVADLVIKEPEVMKSLGSRSSTSLSLFISKLKRNKKCKTTDIGQTTTKNPLVTPQVKSRNSLFGYSSRRINKFCKTCNKKRDQCKKGRSLNETYIKEPKALINATDDVKMRKSQSEKKSLINKIYSKIGKDSRKVINFNDKIKNKDQAAVPLTNCMNNNTIIRPQTPKKIVAKNTKNPTPLKINNKRNICTPTIISDKLSYPKETKTLLLKNKKKFNQSSNKENLFPPTPHPRTKINVNKASANNCDEIKEQISTPPIPLPRTTKTINKPAPIPNENQSIKSLKSKIPRPQRCSSNKSYKLNSQASITNNTTCQGNKAIIYKSLGSKENQLHANHVKNFKSKECGVEKKDEAGIIVTNFLYLSLSFNEEREKHDVLSRSKALSMIDLVILGMNDVKKKVEAMKEYF